MYGDQGSIGIETKIEYMVTKIVVIGTKIICIRTTFVQFTQVSGLYKVQSRHFSM
jgi:hypothetical protein